MRLQTHRGAHLFASWIMLLLVLGPSFGRAQGGTARLSAISSRVLVGTESPVATVNFAVGGTRGEEVLIRAVGPALAAGGVSAILKKPELKVFDASGNLVGSNSMWGADANKARIASVAALSGAQALAPGSEDSAVLVKLPPGRYSAQVSGRDGSKGAALIEVYMEPTSDLRATRLSTRAYVGNTAGALVAKFTVTGAGTEQLLIRGVGPALAQSSQVAGGLPQPQIELRASNDRLIGSNIGWGTSGYAEAVEAVSAAIGASALPEGSADCALLAVLPVGAYTVRLSGANGSMGNGMVELYEVPLAAPPPVWKLNTADTHLTLTIVANHPAIIGLEDADPKVGWNWAPSGTVLPLPGSVYVNDQRYTPSWIFQGATQGLSDGTTVTTTFNTTPSVDGLPGKGLTLTQRWWAANGAGPVEETTSITNNTGSKLTLYDQDVIAADATVYADSTITLWRFGRESVNTPADPGFSTGVFQTTLLRNLNKDTAVQSIISNDCTNGTYSLPFVILDVAGIHGLYLGYEFDFGRFSQSTYASAAVVRSTFSLWNSGRVTEPPGAEFKVPAMFFGTYRGDTDTGSNRMKEWFWNNKITPTIKSTPTEPLVEINIETYLGPTTTESNTEAGCKAWFASNPVASWGVELAKLDSGWTEDEFSAESKSRWNPNRQTWPDGMIAPAIAHQNGVQISLYLVNRYGNADLATPEGVASEEEALLTRYDNWKYDYWRSDGELESTTDYLSHLGFLQVLDDVMAKRPPGLAGRSGFRWENCSAGGSKKSFDLMQRQSMMTIEDSGAWFPSKAGLNFLKAYYANSYMICPVQMKDDNVDMPNYPPAPGTLDTVPWEKYSYRTGFLGAWMDGGGGKVYPQHVALYKRYQRPILRGADVYHLAGFPFPDGTHWDGFEFFNMGLNKGSVILLKPLSSLGNSPTIYLKGLDPAATYNLTFQDRTSLNSSYVSVRGSQLMAGGSGIAAISGAANDYDSEIIWINP